MRVNTKMTVLRKKIKDLHEFPDRLKSLRKELLGLTLDEFSSKVGVSRTFVSDIENSNSGPSAEFIYGITKLGVSLDWLIEGKGEPFLDGLTPADREALQERRRKGYPPTVGEEIRAVKLRESQKKYRTQPDEEATPLSPIPPAPATPPQLIQIAPDDLNRMVKSAVQQSLNDLQKFNKITHPEKFKSGILLDIPLHTDIAAGDPRQTAEHPEKFIVMHSDLIPQNIPFDKIVATRVHGNSMMPTIHHRDVVLLDTSLKSPVSHDNSVCAVYFHTRDGGTIKHLHFLKHGLLLSPHNRDYAPEFIPADEANDELHIIGRVFFTLHNWLEPEEKDDLRRP